ncbi:M48 family metallopeptidase [Synechococcus sp. PCC 7336]|uniref:tetratricopeptide repeat protein n=1 Tax=Synechococcus sp. PCC 7336 TaxID=195250 RepID=UPI0003732EC4|nr:hypothetical protein [Synechococcus sp. PCC 7336]
MSDDEYRRKGELAMRLRRNGDYEAAYHLFVELISRFPQKFGMHLMAGDMADKTNRFEEKEKHFKNASRLYPTHEFASVLYFHALLDNGRKSDAILEMKRFYSVGKPNEYRQLIKDLKEGAIKSESSKKFLLQIEDALNTT